jgi:hypothetical protein
MRKVLLPLTLSLLAALAGCQAPSGESATEKEFEALYREYSARFHEKMVGGAAENMQPAQITAEAARIWNDVFGPRPDLLQARVREILAELDDAPPYNEAEYIEVRSDERPPPTDEQPQGIVVKQFLWNPVGAAHMALNNWLSRLMQPKSFALRQLLTVNAHLFWEAVDRNIDKPVLQMRQGPLIFLVDLTRVDDYYRVDKVRWLRPKSMGPLEPPKTTEEGATEEGATEESGTKEGAAEPEGGEAPPKTAPAGETGAETATEPKPAG